MALINIPTGHVQVRKTTLSIERKPLMLKDYLREDLSSCSSSGFRSFPRRQCCTTIRFLLETDLKRSNHDYSTSTKRFFKRSQSKQGSTSTAISALQRASDAVLNAVKLLSFPSTKSSSSSVQSSSWRKGKGDLPRSFARKLFKRSLWRKADKEDNHGRGEIKRWKLFREFLEEKNQPSVHINVASYTTTDTSSAVVTTSSNSEGLGGADTVSSKKNLREEKNVSNMVGVTGGEDSINCIKDWPNDETKQQLSPVSVLDCPFDGEEEDDGSVFEDQLARVEGTKQRLMQKIIRFEKLAQLEPLELEKRIASAEAELEDEDKPEPNHQKVKTPDLFARERLLMEESGVNISRNEKAQEREQVYAKEMGDTVNWIKFNVEKEEAGSALQLELFTSMMDDLLIDLISH